MLWLQRNRLPNPHHDQQIPWPSCWPRRLHSRVCCSHAMNKWLPRSPQVSIVRHQHPQKMHGWVTAERQRVRQVHTYPPANETRSQPTSAPNLPPMPQAAPAYCSIHELLRHTVQVGSAVCAASSECSPNKPRQVDARLPDRRTHVPQQFQLVCVSSCLLF